MFYNIRAHARVVKLVDATDSKSVGSDTVPVRVRPRAPYVGKALFSRLFLFSIYNLVGLNAEIFRYSKNHSQSREWYIKYKHTTLYFRIIFITVSIGSGRSLPFISINTISG